MPPPERGRGDRRPASAPTAPRSLAEDLRARGDDELVALLLARPDLGNPAARDTTSLAARASTRASVQRALDQLDTPTLQVAEVLAALPAPTSRAALARACGGRVTAEVDTLRQRALVWGRDTGLRLVRTVADLLGPYPAGLGPGLDELAVALPPSRVALWCEALGLPGSGDPVADGASVAALFSDEPTLRARLDAGPEGARRLLERLTWDGPAGSVENAERQVDVDARNPVDWLLARALLVPVDRDRVVVPREAGLSLRGGVALRELQRNPPPLLTTSAASQARVDQAAAGTARDAVRRVHDLAELWGRSPAAVLRAGGLGVRELRRVATSLDVDDATAGRVVELAYAAGLVAQDGELAPSWMPTPGYDEWEAGEVADQWALLATSWLKTSRVAALVGTRDGRGGVRNCLSDAVERPAVVAVRAATLAVLGLALPAEAVTYPSLLEQLRWRQPRGRAAADEQLVRAVLDDASWLGVTALDALSRLGRDLLDPSADPADALAALLPAPMEQVLLQADLTAVAPGPLLRSVRQELRLMADVDSHGGATVYRFGEASVRRGLDAGRTAQDMLRFLADHSATPVPQPLEYLVSDVARRHGRVRVGGASAYLRSDDESVLDELLADRRAVALRLRRLAPTVIAAQADPVTVMETLREMGLAPAAETPEGALLVERPRSRRTPARQRPTPVGTLPELSGSVADAIVRGIRAGDQAEPAASERTNGHPPPPGGMEPAVSLAELRAAAADRRRVWIGVSDPGGKVARRLVEPLGVAAGRVTVFDHGLGEVRVVSVHRVTGVAPEEDEEAG